ncbi:MAG: methyltransferase [Clostridia bacterium]|nr:methyltransferase [Clostridia bacterium]
MTSRELVKATLEFRNTDGRVPRDLWTLLWPHLFEKEELDAIMEKYVWDIGEPEVVYAKQSPVKKGVWERAGEYVDDWGCIFANVQDGIIGEVKQPIVPAEDEDWEDISAIHIPEELLTFDVDVVNESCRKSDKFMLAGAFPRPFEQLQFIRGTENLYVDLMMRPEGLMRFMEQMHDFYCRLLTKWAETEVDGLRFFDDWGTQNSLLINPTLWRELFKPMYKDYIDIAHAHGKKIFMHSDGYILDILPDLVEMGLDAVNCQIFCMGTEKLAPFKGKIAFWGEICRQHILPYGTTEDVENAVRSVYETLWDNGGCIAQCEYGIGAKPENVDAVYDAWVRIHGK